MLSARTRPLSESFRALTLAPDGARGWFALNLEQGRVRLGRRRTVPGAAGLRAGSLWLVPGS